MFTGAQIVEELTSLLKDAERVQDEKEPEEHRKVFLQEVNNKYHLWYRYAIGQLVKLQQSDKYQVMEQEYQGSIWSPKIRSFLSSGLELNPLYTEGNLIFDKWLYPFSKCFKEPLLRQCNIIATIDSIPQEKTASTTSATSTDDSLSVTLNRILKTVLEGIEDERWNTSIRRISQAIFDKIENLETASWNTSIRRIFGVFIEKAANAKGNNDKKLTYEYLAIFLIGAIDGLTIISHDKRGASEEVDLWVSNESKDPFWQNMGSVFIVECKNWGEPVGAQEIRDLRSIMADKHIKLGILLSRKGVTGDKGHDAVLEIQKAIRDEIHIVVIDETDLLEIANGSHPTKKIKQKFHEFIQK